MDYLRGGGYYCFNFFYYYMLQDDSLNSMYVFISSDEARRNEMTL